jgi:hypothetical protein
MGCGIAQIFAEHGIPCILLDSGPERSQTLRADAVFAVVLPRLDHLESGVYQRMNWLT